MPGHDVASKIKQYGLSVVYAAPSPIVDIVFVHGLNGHPYHTWATSKPDVYWPADLLPQALEEQQVRILTYGYDATVGVFTDGASKDKIHNHAEHLAAQLVADRSLKKALERPIIFVCHSLGGLVVKRCLNYSRSVRNTKTERLRSIYVSTFGILFLGTPHNGSDLAKWGILLQHICSAVLPKKFFDTSPQLVESLKTNNETLQNINRYFIDIIGRYRIYFFHESKPMDLKGTRGFVVDEDSAAPVIEGVERMGIERDHSRMCKFESDDAPGYTVVAEAIQRYSEESINLIAARWREEKQIREMERREMAMEAYGDDSLMSATPMPGDIGRLSPAPAHQSGQTSMGNSIISVIELEPNYPSGVPSDSLLVAPPGFRPNSTFFGFDRELEAIDDALHDERRRQMGSCSLLVCGPPGSGKTHLVRQYLYSRRDRYPAGSFWIDARSEESRLTSFWDIIQAVSLIEGAGLVEMPSFGQGEFVETVVEWLRRRQGWLLVFDGVSVESEDIMEKYVKFIPDMKGNDIIFTSVDRNLEKRQRLLYPDAVQVQPLSVKEACQLLYSHLSITSPTAKQAAKAKELVNHFQCLPLAIHATSHRIKATSQALERFNVEHSAIDQRLAGSFVGIMRDLLFFKHIEAVNLVNILAFFAHDIPVGMLHLGRKALAPFDTEIRSSNKPSGVDRNLDETIAILLRYGLCERTLHRYRTSVRGSPTELRRVQTDPSKAEHADGPEARPREDSICESSSTASTSYSIDVLRVHTVVQGFRRDELRTTQQAYQKWLLVAVSLFIQSYRTADEKMKRRPGSTMARDYREFDTHAARLRRHIPHRADIRLEALRRSRHELDEIIRNIRGEIHRASPVQSFNSDWDRKKISIFDRSGSESSEGPTTPSSSPSRASTWNAIAPAFDESPIDLHIPSSIQMRAGSSYGPGQTHPDDGGYSSDMDIPGSVFESSTVGANSPEGPSHFLGESTDKSTPDIGSADLLLHHFLAGRSKKIHKDLGEWHPSPSKAAITPVEAVGMRPRTGSSTSAGSEAEAALAGIHRTSPPASRGGAPRSLSRRRPSIENRSPAFFQVMSRTHSHTSIHDSGEEVDRGVLRGRSPNISSTSPLANSFMFESSAMKPPPPIPQRRSNSRLHSRHPSYSHELPPLPIEENITITGPSHRPSPARSPWQSSSLLPTRQSVAAAVHPSQSSGPVFSEGTVSASISAASASAASATVTGYTSQPMSRDASKESQYSQASEPCRYPPPFTDRVE